MTKTDANVNKFYLQFDDISEEYHAQIEARWWKWISRLKQPRLNFLLEIIEANGEHRQDEWLAIKMESFVKPNWLHEHGTATMRYEQ